jgi:tRNA(fMet)-specific endonuclease VapC
MAWDYLLDTSIVSDLLHGHRRAVSRATDLAAAGRVFLCSIVRGEILFGLAKLARGRKRRELSQKTASIFATMTCLPVPEAAADIYASFKRERERRGISLNDNDLWIAATAATHDMVLITRDSDFADLRGLVVKDWTQ